MNTICIQLFVLFLKPATQWGEMGCSWDQSEMSRFTYRAAFGVDVVLGMEGRGFVHARQAVLFNPCVGGDAALALT